MGDTIAFQQISSFEELRICFKPIGYVIRRNQPPKLRSWSKDIVFKYDEQLRRQIVEVFIFPSYSDALERIEEYEYLWLIWFAHLSGKPSTLKVHIHGDPSQPIYGVFATRSPVRPNNIMLSLVKLIERRGNVLVVKGTEAFDGTPVIDIKPYIPSLDTPESIP